MADRASAWWRAHRPTKRRLIQVYAALLYNAHLKGFIKGDIYTGPVKGLCVPGLNCYSCPGAVGACPLGALQNALAASGSRAPWYALGIVMLFGLTLGRTICGWLCPAGLLQELAHKLPTPKLRKGRVTRALSYLKYGVLAVFVVGIPLASAAQRVPLPAFCKYICPAGTLEGALPLLAHPANDGLRAMLGPLFTAKAAILAAILIACVFVYRAFCRFLCPLGAIYGLFARLSMLGVTVEASRCTHCDQCVQRCPMDIRLVGDHECIHCGACVSACPTQAIQWHCGAIRLAPSETAPVDQARKVRHARAIIAWACALAVLGVTVWATHRPAAPAAPAAAIEAADDIPVGHEPGMRCPDFTLPLCGAEDAVFALHDFAGKPVVINFWATWCGPCVSELPYFQALCDAYGDRLGLVAIHSAIVTDDVQAFLAGHGYTFPVALDADGTVLSALGGSNLLPMTVVLDREGRVVHHQVGSVTPELLERLIAPLL